MRPVAWLVSVAVISATAHAEPLYCSTSSKAKREQTDG